MTSTMSGNGRVPRKSLNDQLDRFDSMLDGLGEAIPEVIADSVRQAVGEAVRLAVEASVREVLGSPEMLRAALARDTPAADPIPAKHEVTTRRTLKDLLRAAGEWAGRRVTNAKVAVKKVLHSAWTRSLGALRNGCARLLRVGRLAKSAPGTMAAIVIGLWRFRRSSSIALAVGVACAFGVYHSGPAIASVVSGFTGTAMTATGMAVLTLWRLISGGDKDA